VFILSLISILDNFLSNKKRAKSKKNKKRIG
jgi:hypothetical protein